jgi:cytochrome P450
MLAGNLPYRVKSLHDEYGSIVRIAPNELSIIDERAWKDIFPRRDFLRPPQWGARPPNVEAHNFISAPLDVHTRLRKAFTPAFSEKALQGYEPLIRKYFNKLIDRIDTAIYHSKQKGKPVAELNMVKWFNFTTFDIIGELSWGKSFDCLENGTGHAFMDVLLHFKAALIGTTIKHYQALDALMPYITPKSALTMLHNIFATGRERVQQRMSVHNETRDRDILSNVVQYNKSNPESSLSQEEVEFNALTLIIAGSETLTTVFSGALHHLLSHPSVHKTLTSEIRSGFSAEEQITGASVSSLPYLNAVINETLRLCPPIPDVMRRQVPSGGAVVAGEHFDEGVVLGVACWPMFQSDKHFPSPTVFAPERWLDGDKGKLTANGKAFYPFALGPHGCIGQSLAWLEMRLLLALLLFRFDFDVPEKSEQWQWTDQKIYWTWEKKPLIVSIKARPV